MTASFDVMWRKSPLDHTIVGSSQGRTTYCNVRHNEVSSTDDVDVTFQSDNNVTVTEKSDFFSSLFLSID
jgi:hypothetical protein